MIEKLSLKSARSTFSITPLLQQRLIRNPSKPMITYFEAPLLYNDKMRTPVSGPGLFILAFSNGAFLAIADGIQP